MPGSQPTVTIEQATAQLDRHVHEVAAAVFPGATLKVQSAMSVIDCNDPDDHGPLGRVTAGVFYEVVGFPRERNAEAFDLAKRYWSDRQYKLLSDHPDFVRVEAPDPDFTTVALHESSDGTRILFVGGDTPCVWRNGTPAPRS